MFFGIGDSIYAVDALAPTFSARIVAGQVIPYAAGYEWGLAMGTCRKLLVGTHDSILEVDIDSGVSTVAIAAPQLLGGYQPYVGCVAYNAWTDEVAYHHNTPYYWVPVGPLHGHQPSGHRELPGVALLFGRHPEPGRGRRARGRRGREVP